MKDNSRIKNIDKIFKELVAKQRKDIPTNKKLQLSDIKRIARRINGSICDPNKCSLWSGYITNMNNTAKGTYVNFYFRKKKAALHRLLYINFVGPLHDEDEYIKFSCDNKGRCCNIYHMDKYKYNVNESRNKDESTKPKLTEEIIEEQNDIESTCSKSSSSDSNDLVLTFD